MTRCCEWDVLRSRCLRTYERMAARQYDCWHCTKYIEPGDLYCGEVLAQRVRHAEGHVSDMVLVITYHVFCEPPPEDFDEEVVERSFALPLAA